MIDYRTRFGANCLHQAAQFSDTEPDPSILDAALPDGRWPRVSRPPPASFGMMERHRQHVSVTIARAFYGIGTLAVFAVLGVWLFKGAQLLGWWPW